MAESIDRHAWSYGNTDAWRDYSLRLEKALIAAGIRDVRREKITYFDNPLTAQWRVSFPKEYYAIAERVSDGLSFPKR